MSDISVDVPGVGIVHFPGNMQHADIASALKTMTGHNLSAQISGLASSLGITQQQARSQGVGPAVQQAQQNARRGFSPGLSTGASMSGAVPDPNATGNILTQAAADVYGRPATEQGIGEAPGLTGSVARLGTRLTSPFNVALSAGTGLVGGLIGAGRAALTEGSMEALRAAHMAEAAGDSAETAAQFARAANLAGAARIAGASGAAAIAGVAGYFGGQGLYGAYNSAVNPAPGQSYAEDPGAYLGNVLGNLGVGALGLYGAARGIGDFKTAMQPPDFAAMVEQARIDAMNAQARAHQANVNTMNAQFNAQYPNGAPPGVQALLPSLGYDTGQAVTPTPPEPRPMAPQPSDAGLGMPDANGNVTVLRGGGTAPATPAPSATPVPAGWGNVDYTPDPTQLTVPVAPVAPPPSSSGQSSPVVSSVPPSPVTTVSGTEAETLQKAGAAIDTLNDLTKQPLRGGNRQTAINTYGQLQRVANAVDVQVPDLPTGRLSSSVVAANVASAHDALSAKFGDYRNPNVVPTHEEMADPFSQWFNPQGVGSNVSTQAQNSQGNTVADTSGGQAGSQSVSSTPSGAAGSGSVQQGVDSAHGPTDVQQRLGSGQPSPQDLTLLSNEIGGHSGSGENAVMNPADIGVHPAMQYKKEGITDTKNNVTNALKGTHVYDVDQGGAWTVWKSPEGQTYVANGHHRAELANRAESFVRIGPDGKPVEVPRQVPVRVLDAKHGWTIDKARGYAALENIRDGKGTPLDAMDVMHDLGIPPDEFASRGMSTTSEMVKQVAGLMRLDPQVIARVRMGDLSDAAAAGLGSVHGLTPEAQRGAADELARRGYGTFARGAALGHEYLADQQAGNLATGHTGQMDMFGGEFNAAKSTAGERIELKEAVGRLVAAKRSELLKPVGASLQEGEHINAEARQAEARRMAESPAALQERLGLLYNQDAVKAEIARLAGEMANGTKTKSAAAGELAGKLLPHVGESVATLANPGAISMDQGSGVSTPERSGSDASAGELPLATGDQPPIWEKGVIGSRIGKTTGTLYVSGAGIRAIFKGRGTAQGIMLDQDHYLTARDRLSREIRSEKDAEKRAGLRQLLRNIEKVYKDQGSVRLVASVASVNKETGARRLRTNIVRHEDVHAAQFALQGGYSVNSATTTEPMRRALSTSPLWSRVVDALSQSGYYPEQAVLEAPAYLISGDYGRLGLNEQEAKDFAAHYFSAATRLYGPDGVARLVQRGAAGIRSTANEAVRTTTRELQSLNLPIPGRISAANTAAGGEPGGYSARSGDGLRDGRGGSLESVDRSTVPGVQGGLDEPPAALADEFRNGRFRRVYEIDKPTGDAVNALNAATETAKTTALTWANHITEHLTDPKDLDLFERLALHNRAEQLEADQGSAGNVPKLSTVEQAERASWLAGTMPTGATFDRWSKVYDAVARFQSTVSPDIEAKRRQTAPNMSIVKTPDNFFMSLFPQTDSSGNPIPANMVGAGRPVGGGPTANRGKVRRTRFARQATGSGSDYRQNFKENLTAMYAEVYPKWALSNVMATASRAGFVIRDNQKTFPPTYDPATQEFIKPNGEQVPSRVHVLKNITYPVVDANGRNHWVTRDMTVRIPDALEQAVRETTLPAVTPSGGAKLLNASQGLITRVTLAAPSTMVWHVWRIVSNASRMGMPAMTGGMKWLPYAGPKVQLLYDMFNTDFNNPVVFQRLQRVMSAGGGSFRPFSDFIKGTGWLSKVADWPHEKLFGLPEGKGLNGFDLRARVVLEGLREAFEGNQDPQRTREFLNQLGQYTKNPDYLIQAARYLNPYAATQLPMKLTEYRQMAGGSGLRGATPQERAYMHAQVIFAGLVGFMVAKELLNKGKSGHWSWQNAKGKEHLVDLGHGYYLNPTAIDPGISRAMRDTGLTSLAITHNPTQAPIDVMNNALTTVGSGLEQIGVGSLTGSAPHLHLDPQGNLAMMRVSPRMRDKNKYVETAKQVGMNVVSSILHANAITGGLSEVAGMSAYKGPDPSWKVTGALQMLFGPVVTHQGAGGSSSAGRSGRRGR